MTTVGEEARPFAAHELPQLCLPSVRRLPVRSRRLLKLTILLLGLRRGAVTELVSGTLLAMSKEILIGSQHSKQPLRGRLPPYLVMFNLAEG